PHLGHHQRGGGFAQARQGPGSLRRHQGVRRHGRDRLMRLDRRAFTGGLVATLAAPYARAAGTAPDAAGRRGAIPDRVTRVFPAGPPAAILLYTLAPELLLGWTRANRAEECALLLPDICARPEVGRLTGRGNSANLESVLALKPDLI